MVCPIEPGTLWVGLLHLALPSALYISDGHSGTRADARTGCLP